MDNQKAQRPTVESETSRANRIKVKPPSLLSANAEAVANCRDNKGKPFEATDWEQRQKDYKARDKYGDHNQMNGGGTYRRGDVYDDE